MERTWKVGQQEIIDGSAIGVAGKAFSLDLDEFGPYSLDYTRNGRCVSLVIPLDRNSADGFTPLQDILH